MADRYPVSVERTLLAATAAGALLAAAAAFAGPPIGTFLGPQWSPLRLAIGIPAVLLLPGYALTAALFGRASGLDALGRLALSIGLSIAQLPLSALALSQSAWGITPTALVASLVGLTLVWCALALLRGTGSAGNVGPAADAAGPTLPAPVGAWAALNRFEQGVLALCAALLVVCAGALLVVVPRSAGTSGAEFYMLGAAGQADAFPYGAAPGNPVRVQLGLNNHEAAAIDYFVVAIGEAGIVGSIPPFSVAPGATWAETLSVAVPAYGFDQRVEILLFRRGQQHPHRRLRLLLDAPPPGVPTPIRVRPTPIPRP